MNSISHKSLIALIYCFSFSMITIAEPIKALIIDGQNNHKWEETTPVLKHILGDCGLFAVDIATSPPNGESLENFRPKFAEYDVVISNYNGKPWSNETQRDFEHYIKNGGGFVSVHAADNAFPAWEEYNKMIALGGWGQRDETWGPMVRVRDDKIVFDNSPGRGGAHGPRWNYPVVMHDLDHPISKGLPKVWKHAKDELYAKLRGPAKLEALLGYARSTLTNENEPLLFTVEYGKGRIFHTALGHDVYAMRCVGFSFTLQRGTEWAATGNVTLQEIPDSFPSEDKVSLWLIPVDTASIVNYEYGQSRQALSTVESNIRIASPIQLRNIEEQMLTVLNTESATFHGRSFACQMLRRIGTEKSVSTLGQFLDDEKLSDPARLALQGIDSDQVDILFRESLSSLHGDNLIGVIGSIAERGDQDAVETIIQFLDNDNQALQQVSLRSIGRIGGEKALELLYNLDVKDELEYYRLDALLSSADSFAQSNPSATISHKVYNELSSSHYPIMIRLAAYNGIINNKKEEALPLILTLLRDNEPKLQQAACGPFLKILPGAPVSKTLAQELNKLPIESQVVVLNALAIRGHKNVTPEVMHALESDQESVRLAATAALGSLGDDRAVMPLIQIANQGGNQGKVAQDSLAQVQGDRVNYTLINALRTLDEKTRVSAINALVARNAKETIPVLFRYADDYSIKVRESSFRALERLGDANDIPTILNMIQSKSDENDIQTLVQIVRSLSKQSTDTHIYVDAIKSLLPNSSTVVKQAFIHLLTDYSGQQAFLSVADLIQDQNEQVQTAALEALSNWKDNTPLEFLLTHLSDFNHEVQRAKAFECISHALNQTAVNSPWFEHAKENSKSKNEKLLMIQTLRKKIDLQALNLLESYLEDQEVQEEAIAAFELLINRLSASKLDRNTWIVSASHNSGNAKSAIDGQLNTRWDTAAVQIPGMWFQIDLGVERSIQKIVLDSKRSRGDYPRGYEVLLSNDGQTWSDSVAGGEGKNAFIEIDIPNQSARFIKILQTGRVNGLFWSIHELYIEATMDSDLLHKAKAKLESVR